VLPALWQVESHLWGRSSNSLKASGLDWEQLQPPRLLSRAQSPQPRGRGLGLYGGRFPLPWGNPSEGRKQTKAHGTCGVRAPALASCGSKPALLPTQPNCRWASPDIALLCKDTLAERLRRRPAKPMGFPRVGSNPTGVATWKRKRRGDAAKRANPNLLLRAREKAQPYK
jgi:hypothetical protein